MSRFARGVKVDGGRAAKHGDRLGMLHEFEPGLP
jgi:hypothetical protein